MNREREAALASIMAATDGQPLDAATYTRLDDDDRRRLLELLQVDSDLSAEESERLVADAIREHHQRDGGSGGY